jgi:hypothetical protein
MKCPCEECIKLPICIRRKSVFCTDLAVFAHATTKYGEPKMWSIVEKSLPNAIRIYSDNITDHHAWYRR